FDQTAPPRLGDAVAPGIEKMVVAQIKGYPHAAALQPQRLLVARVIVDLRIHDRGIPIGAVAIEKLDGVALAPQLRQRVETPNPYARHSGRCALTFPSNHRTRFSGHAAPRQSSGHWRE